MYSRFDHALLSLFTHGELQFPFIVEQISATEWLV